LQHLATSPVASYNVTGRAARWKGGADGGGHLFASLTIYPRPSCITVCAAAGACT